MERKDLLNLIQMCGYYIYNRKKTKYGQLRILLFLAQNDKVYQKQLQEYLKVKSGSMSEIILKMAAADLLERKRDTLDGRRIIIGLTDLGREKINELRSQYECENMKLFTNFSDEECESLGQMLAKLYESMVKS